MSDAAGLRTAGAVAAAFLGAAAVASAIAVEADRLRLPPLRPSAAPSARLSAALSMRRFAADRSWIDTLQYCGDPAFIVERGRGLLRMSDHTTDLDPTFVEAYAFGAAMLMWQGNRPAEAARLLRKGIAENPRAVRLKYYLAAFTYRRLNDLGGEVAMLEVLARDPSAPIILRRILANAYEKQGRIGQAALIWRIIWFSTMDPGERRWVAAKLSKYRIDLEKFQAGP